MINIALKFNHFVDFILIEVKFWGEPQISNVAFFYFLTEKSRVNLIKKRNPDCLKKQCRVPQVRKI